MIPCWNNFVWARVYENNFTINFLLTYKLRWRTNLREIAVYEDTMFTKTCGRQILDRYWNVRENYTMIKIVYAVATLMNGTIVGHLPRHISRLCSLFLRRGGRIMCIVTGGKMYSIDLPQGGLEIPCQLIFKGTPKEIQKLKNLLSDSC